MSRTSHWARAQNNLGTHLVALGGLRGDEALLQRAMRAFLEALEFFTQARWPLSWAQTSDNLGCVYRALGNNRGDGALLLRAIATHEQVLRFLGEDGVREDVIQRLVEVDMWREGEELELEGLDVTIAPDRDGTQRAVRGQLHDDWARAQGELGNALRALGELRGDGAFLQGAVAAYEAALEIRTQERFPVDWARTQSDLAAAMSMLGRLHGEPAWLQAAGQRYEAVQTVYMRERAPRSWAEAKRNLADTFLRLVKLKHDEALVRRAIEEYEASSTVQELDPQAADQLRSARKLLVG